MSVTDRHPLEVDLVAYVDGELDPLSAKRVATHVEGCSSCAHLIRDLEPPIADINVAEIDVVDLSAYADLLDGPAATEPHTGEVWSLEWEHLGLLVAVLSDGPTYRVCPLSAETPEPTTDTTPVLVSSRDRQVPLHLWFSVTADVGLGVFSRLAGRLTDDTRAVPKAQSDAGSQTWVAALHGLAYRCALEAFETAQWVSDHDGAEVVSLDTLMRNQSIRPTSLAQQTGIPPSSVTELVRGRRTPSDDEAQRLASVLGVTPEALRAPVQVPSALQHAIERPVHRDAIRSRAAQAGVTEPAERQQLAEVLLQTAARTTTSERDVEAWDQLLRHQLTL